MVKYFLFLSLACFLIAGVAEAKTRKHAKSTSIPVTTPYKIWRTNTAPIIDGKMDKIWCSIPWVWQDHYTIQGTATPDSEDYIGLTKAMWDDNNLYLLFYSEAPNIYDNPANPAWNQTDDEVYISATNSKSTSGYTPTDYCLQFPHYLKGKGNVVGTVISGGNFDSTGCAFAIQDDNSSATDSTAGLGGWFLELKIPLSDIFENSGVTPVAGTVIGWDLQQDIVEDPWATGRQYISCWWDTENLNWRETDTFGEAILSPDVNIGAAKIIKTNQAITIDGVKDAAYAASEDQSADYWRFVDGTTSDCPNPSDANVIASTLYDDNNLYLFFDVNDNNITDIPSTPFWNQSAVEFFLGPDDKAYPYSSLDQQYIIPNWMKGQEASELTSIFGGKIDTTGCAFKIADKADGTGYSVEVQIPWANLNLGLPIAEGTTIGYLFGMDYSSSGSYRTGVAKWWDNTNGSWNDANTWGEAVLGNGGSTVITPTVKTIAATSVTNTSAVLNATVNPNGGATTAYFEWGTDKTLSSPVVTSSQDLGSGKNNQQVAANLTGLSPNTAYYYRIVAQDSGRTARGSIVSFTTSNTDLRASIVNGHVLLEWSSIPGAVSYNIYRGTQYDFVPDVSNRISENILDEDPETAGIQWTDPSTTVVGDTAVHHFWRVSGMCANTMPRLVRKLSKIAAGVNHTVTGKVFNSDQSIPEDSEIQFEAYIASRPAEVLNETTVGCGYKSGYWFINVGNLPTAWSIGDTLHVDVRNVVNNQLGKLNLVLTRNDPDMAPDLNLSIIVESGISNVAGEFAYPLYSTSGTDINEIAVGMDTRLTRNPINNAEDLVNAIPHCTVGYSWSATGQGFIGHPKGLPFNNFPVYQGYPYAVNVPVDTVWTVAGCLPDTNFHLITTPGTDINHIAVPFSKNNLTNADLLVRDIPGGTTVYSWSASSQGAIGHAKGLPFNNFLVKPGYPYYVNVTCDSTWPAPPTLVSNPNASKKNSNGRAKSLIASSNKKSSSNSNIKLSGGVPHMVYGKYKGRISGGMKMRVWVASRLDEVLTESIVGTGCDSTYWWVNVGTFPTPWKAGQMLEVELEDSTNQLGGTTSIKLTNDGADCADLINVDKPIRTLRIEQDESEIPRDYSLVGNFPNPFNPTTTIVYHLPECTDVTIEVFDMIGRSVKVLYSGTQKPGEYLLNWDGTNNNGSKVSSGVYFYKMKTNAYTSTKKMILLK